MAVFVLSPYFDDVGEPEIVTPTWDVATAAGKPDPDGLQHVANVWARLLLARAERRLRERMAAAS
jgi:hypothetical protein